MIPERLFPIQSSHGAEPHPTSIPWAVADLAYSVYRSRYGPDQSLERIAERCGFAADEMDLLLPDWRERSSVLARVIAQRDEARAALREMPGAHECADGRICWCMPWPQRISDTMTKCCEYGHADYWKHRPWCDAARRAIGEGAPKDIVCRVCTEAGDAGLEVRHAPPACGEGA